MSAHRKPLLLAAAAGLTLFLAAATAQQEAPKSPVAKITGKTLIAANELKWEPLPGLDGCEYAKLVGDISKEAHRAFFKYPAGLKSPPHTHSFGDRGVIVSGTLGLAIEGAPMKKLSPGSFFSIAAGVEHVTTVEGSEPCVFYMEREGLFDVKLKEAAPAAPKK
jgi:quercetin dioxygenase-like cupin family protein